MKELRWYKKTLLFVFIIPFALLFSLILIQTIAGDIYDSQPLMPWIWLNLLYVPSIVLLFKVKNLTNKVSLSSLLLLSFVFVLGSVGTLLLQPLSTSLPIKLLSLSLFILLPLELVLLYLIWAKMIKKHISEQEQLFTEPVVFISYNHKDKEVANRIKEFIESENIEVIIDNDKLMAGTLFKDFIDNSVRNSNVTISLVSNNSLHSSWVAMETINTFYHEKFMKNKKFIACYLDKDFFKPGYILKAIDHIDTQIKNNQDLMQQYHDKQIDSRDLNSENTRLISLRNNLDAIIDRLRNSFCLDVRNESFETSMVQLLKAIKNEG